MAVKSTTKKIQATKPKAKAKKKTTMKSVKKPTRSKSPKSAAAVA